VLVLGHAVGATQVALVHDADAQAAVNALVTVGERKGHGGKLLWS
jgi:hypothetical protein